MDIYSSFVLAFGISSLFSGIVVFFDKYESIGKLFLMYSFCLFVWAVGASLMLNNQTSKDLALVAIRIGDGFILFVPVLWVHLVGSITGRVSMRMPGWLCFFYVVCFALSLGVFSDYFIPEVKPILTFDHYKVAGPLYHLFSLLFLILVPLGFAFIFQNIMERKKSNQSILAMLGFALISLVGYLAGGVCILPAYSLHVPQYGLLLMPIYPFGLAFFLTKHGLFDEERMAQAAHKDKLAALGILTASINHEIRAPLFMMRGSIEVGNSLDQVREKILPQIDRITGIVSRLTHFAKKGVEEDAKLEEIDLKDVLSDIRPLFQHQINYQSIEYVQSIPSDLPKLMADRRYLEEILFNLILNACQALKNTPNPKIVLTVSDRGGGRQSLVGGPSEIEISISDNGPGISKDQLKIIFKPFHTTKQEGTGLGLYITKQLVEKCGGASEVKS